MFFLEYIAKCVDFRDGIEGDVGQYRNSMRLGEVATSNKSHFEIGDAFHHQKMMKPGEYKIVKEVLFPDIIIANDNEYPIDECVILPTEDLLRAAVLDKWSVRNDNIGQGHEHLLNEIINSGRYPIPNQT